MAKNCEILVTVYLLTDAILTDINLVPLIPDEDKTFTIAFVLDVRVAIWNKI